MEIGTFGTGTECGSKLGERLDDLESHFSTMHHSKVSNPVILFCTSSAAIANGTPKRTWLAKEQISQPFVSPKKIVLKNVHILDVPRHAGTSITSN